MDKLSYAWGMALGQQLRGMGVENLDKEAFNEAVAAAFDGKETKISAEEAQKLIQEYLQELTSKEEAQSKAVGEKLLA